jgi:hypothetical protein
VNLLLAILATGCLTGSMRLMGHATIGDNVPYVLGWLATIVGLMVCVANDLGNGAIYR